MSTKHIAASVHSRLLNLSKATERPYAEVLQYYGIERFLYRLSKSTDASHFILKGALVFVAWGIPQTRATRDIDLLGFGLNQIATLEDMMRHVCLGSVVEDGLIFDANSVRGARIQEGANYEGVRIKLLGYLDRARILIQIDIGFGDIVYPSPIAISYPTLLDFPSPQLKAYSRETVVAEKYHALVMLGQANSRMKDFYDLFTLAGQYSFNGEILLAAISETFRRRDTPLPLSTPTGLHDTFAQFKSKQWDIFLKRMRLTNTTTDFLSVIQLLRTFLDLEKMSNHVWESQSWQPINH